MSDDTITRLSEHAYEESFRLFMKLFDERIQSLREKNDTATVDEFKENKGAIRELQEIKKLFRPRREIKHHDGAFRV